MGGCVLSGSIVLGVERGTGRVGVVRLIGGRSVVGVCEAYLRYVVLTTVRTAAVRRGSLATITTPHQIFSNFRCN